MSELLLVRVWNDRFSRHRRHGVAGSPPWQTPSPTGAQAGRRASLAGWCGRTRRCRPDRGALTAATSSQRQLVLTTLRRVGGSGPRRGPRPALQRRRLARDREADVARRQLAACDRVGISSNSAASYVGAVIALSRARRAPSLTSSASGCTMRRTDRDVAGSWRRRGGLTHGRPGRSPPNGRSSLIARWVPIDLARRIIIAHVSAISHPHLGPMETGARAA